MTRSIDIVLIGPPGSGKGTQAARVCQHFGVPTVSTGEILRAAVRAQSPLGREVHSTLTTGGLVGDDLMIELVRSRLTASDAVRGFVLDGFPRTVGQAQALDDMLDGRRPIAALLEVPGPELERRLGARRTCSTCKALFATGTRYGSEEELCSHCGGTLIRRDDDHIEVIRTRLQTYERTAAPLVEYYRTRRALMAIDGQASPTAVTRELFAGIHRALGCR